MKSGYKGVTWDRRRQMWRSVFHDPWTHIGFFGTEIQAAVAYDLMAKKHGYVDPLKFNFPRGLNKLGEPL